MLPKRHFDCTAALVFDVVYVSKREVWEEVGVASAPVTKTKDPAAPAPA